MRFNYELDTIIKVPLTVNNESLQGILIQFQFDYLAEEHHTRVGWKCMTNASGVRYKVTTGAFRKRT